MPEPAAPPAGRRGSGASESVQPPAPEAAAPPPPPHSPRKAFTIQLHAFKSEARAEQVVAAYRRMDLEVFSAEATVPGRGRWWRILVGEFRTRADAHTFGQRLIQDGTIQNFGVVRIPGAER